MDFWRLGNLLCNGNLLQIEKLKTNMRGYALINHWWWWVFFCAAFHVVICKHHCFVSPPFIVLISSLYWLWVYRHLFFLVVLWLSDLNLLFQLESACFNFLKKERESMQLTSTAWIKVLCRLFVFLFDYFSGRNSRSSRQGATPGQPGGEMPRRSHPTPSTTNQLNPIPSGSSSINQMAGKLSFSSST